MNPPTVDEFVKERVLPEFRPVVAMIRELVRECAPEAEESISYGIPAYRLRRIIAVISPTKKDITFSLSRGAQIKDKYGLLRGVGKSSKHVKIKSVATANREALRYYIKQAVKLDAK
jgi:uncharacterized protein YdhG (YjbR/CyaY superfamily)